MNDEKYQKSEVAEVLKTLNQFTDSTNNKLSSLQKDTNDKLSSLQKEQINISRAVHTFIGAQTTWTREHDKRSRENLGAIRTEQSHIRGATKELQTQVAALPPSVAKLTALLEAADKLTETKIDGLKSNIKWLWVGFSGATATLITVIAVAIKVLI